MATKNTDSKKPNPDGIVRIQVRIRRSTRDALAAEAKARILPLAAVVREVLDAHVAQLDARDEGGA